MDTLESVEDTKGNSGESGKVQNDLKLIFVIKIRLIFDHEKCLGCIIITNLRFVWHAAQYQKINLCKFEIYS